jgi:spore maturation protein CgeB
VNILYIGFIRGNCKLTLYSLRKIHQNVDYINTKKILPFHNFSYRLFYHVHPKLFEKYLDFFFYRKIKKKYDLIFINNSEFITNKVLDYLKRKSKKILFYMNDNPFVNRDKKRWFFFKNNSKKYDLIVFQQKSRLKFAKKHGLKKYISVIPPYFKNTLSKNRLNTNLKQKYKQDIVFVGTWFPERGRFFYKLKKLGLNFKIYGTLWDKDKLHYNYLKKNIVLENLSIDKYSKIIQSAKIALCLLSKENFDDITRRCIEIPALGTLLCSESTQSLKNLLKDKIEAVYFNNVNDCFKICTKLLKNNNLIKKISNQGNNKIIKTLKPESTNILKKIISVVFKNDKITNKFIYRF